MMRVGSILAVVFAPAIAFGAHAPLRPVVKGDKRDTEVSVSFKPDPNAEATRRTGKLAEDVADESGKVKVVFEGQKEPQDFEIKDVSKLPIPVVKGDKKQTEVFVSKVDANGEIPWTRGTLDEDVADEKTVKVMLEGNNQAQDFEIKDLMKFDIGDVKKIDIEDVKKIDIGDKNQLCTPRNILTSVVVSLIGATAIGGVFYGGCLPGAKDVDAPEDDGPEAANGNVTGSDGDMVKDTPSKADEETISSTSARTSRGFGFFLKAIIGGGAVLAVVAVAMRSVMGKGDAEDEEEDDDLEQSEKDIGA